MFKINEGYKRSVNRAAVIIALLLTTVTGWSQTQPSVWNAMKSENKVLKLTAWFTAQDVDKYLSTPAGFNDALNWCKKYGVTKVHLEAFGRGLYAKRETLIAARDHFRQEGIEVSGGITTTKFGKNAVNGGDGAIEWNGSVCYTNIESQKELQRIAEYTASMFDEIILDDLYFTQCQCDECIRARGNLTWAKYYKDLMDKMSRDRVVGPARATNSKVKVIIKYPQWNDEFHMRGYDVVGEPPIFDGVWIGTEDRDFEYDKNNLGYEIGYNAYFNMRWLATLGNASGGGWFDTGEKRTKVNTYMEQARHTVLGAGNNMILWNYSGHLEEPYKMDALVQEFPGLIKLAKIVQGKTIKGVHIVKPGNSEPFEEEWICSFLGELGIPFVPGSVVNEDVKSAVFPVQVLKDPDFIEKFQRIVSKGTPVVLTDGLAKRIADHVALLNNKNVTILPIKGSAKTVLNLSREQIKVYRDKLLAPFGIKFDAPARVELYLYGDNTYVVENINDEAVDVTLDLPHLTSATKALTIPEEGGTADLTRTGKSIKMHISPHALIAVNYK